MRRNRTAETYSCKLPLTPFVSEEGKPDVMGFITSTVIILVFKLL